MSEPSELIVRTEPIGGSPLARAAIGGQLPAWYEARPAGAAAWNARCEVVRESAAAGRWLDTLRPALAATGLAATRLERVARERGVVVTTGQQPGLFGGPVYTWSKALSALALADEIEAATGVPTAPVFWAANDDADFAEACWTAVGVQGGAERLQVAAGAPLGRTMADMPLGDIEASLDALVRACGATVDARPLDAVRSAYRTGATVGGAYVAFLRHVFEPFGIAVLDAAHANVVTAARPMLLRALDRSTPIAAALHDRDQAISAAGFEPQVSEVAGLSLVFERAQNGGEKRRIPLTEAAAVAAADGSGRPGVLSPNVLLRPVVERAILPTVAYVGGPGEIAYFAQVGVVASTLGVDTPLIVPRWSTTIIEPHVARILARLRIDESELADPHRAEGRVARESLPPALTSALADLRTELTHRVNAVATSVRDGALPLPAGVVDGVERAMAHRLERLERRVVAAAKRRESETMRQIGTARGALFPLGTRQERALSIIPFLARHGTIVTDRMLRGARTHAQEIVGTGRALEAVAQSR